MGRTGSKLRYDRKKYHEEKVVLCKLGGLLGLAMMLLWVGNHPELVGGWLQWWYGLASGSQMTDMRWYEVMRLGLAQMLDFSGVASRDPWLMSPMDLGFKRVVYNWVTKPGLRWLLLTPVVGIVVMRVVWGLGKVLYSGGMMASKRAATLIMAPARAMPMSVVVRVAGTVAISSKSGLIYAAMGEEADSRFEQGELFTTKLGLVEIRVVRG